MKKIFYLTASLFLIVCISCTDRSTFRNPATYQLQNGAYVRFVNIPPTSFEPEFAQTINISEEVYDPNGNVSLYELSVEIFLTSTGLTYVADNIATISSFPNTLNITSQTIADAIGVDITAFGAGDLAAFTAVVTRNDGVKFYGIQPEYDGETGTIGVGNTAAPLLNAPAYKDAMNFGYVVACPLESDSFYTGAYNLVNTIPAPCGGLVFLDQEVELVAISVYQRTFRAIYLEQLGIGNGPITFTINFICGEVTGADNQGTGLQCANGIFFNSSAVPGGYSETSDIELIVNFQEDCSDCGEPADFETSITLTKV